MPCELSQLQILAATSSLRLKLVANKRGCQPKLDEVGPVDNRPSTDKLRHFVSSCLLLVCRQYERRDVGREVCHGDVHALPGVGLALLVRVLLVLQQELGALDVLLPDGHQQGVLQLDALLHQHLHQLVVLVLHADDQPVAAEGVHAVDTEEVGPPGGGEWT